MQLILRLFNGNKLVCGAGATHMWGGNIIVLDNHDNEIGYWEATEFEDNAEIILGAMFILAGATESPNDLY